MGARDRQHAGMHLAHQIAAALARLGTQTTRHDDFAVFCQRFTNGVQTFPDGIVNETTGIDNDQISAFKSFRCLVALGTESREDQLRIG